MCIIHGVYFIENTISTTQYTVYFVSRIKLMKVNVRGISSFVINFSFCWWAYPPFVFTQQISAKQLNKWIWNGMWLRMFAFSSPSLQGLYSLSSTHSKMKKVLYWSFVLFYCCLVEFVLVVWFGQSHVKKSNKTTALLYPHLNHVCTNYSYSMYMIHPLIFWFRNGNKCLVFNSTEDTYA